MNYEYWNDILTSRRPDLGLEAASVEGALQKDFPEVYAMVGFGGQAKGHKDLWDHTKKVVRQAKNTPVIRWAALWHDVGKVETFSTESGKVTFHQHEYMSARLFKQAMRRTQMLDKPMVDKVYALIRGLGLLEGYSSEWTDSAVRRLHKELGGAFTETLLLSRADVTSKHAHKREKVHRLIHELEERALSIAAEDAKVPPLPKGLGRTLMVEFDIPPSKQLGDLMKALETAIAEGNLEPHQEASYYVGYLKGILGEKLDEGLSQAEDGQVTRGTPAELMALVRQRHGVSRSK